MQHRQVPGLTQQRQGFSRANLPPITSPMTEQPQPMQLEQVSTVAESIHDLAQEIYAKLAFDHIKSNHTPDPRLLRELAQAAHNAAISYFNQLGIQFDEAKANG